MMAIEVSRGEGFRERFLGSFSSSENGGETINEVIFGYWVPIFSEGD